MTRTTLFQEVIRRSAMASKWGVLLAATVGVSQALPDAMQWTPHPIYSTNYVVVAILITVFWFVAQYAITLNMIRRTPTLGGLIRFIVVSLGLLLPLVATLSSMLLLPPLIGKPASAAVLIIGLLISVSILLVLRAWPVAQALSSKFVPPIQVLRATKGYRWGLLWVPSLIGGLDKLVPGYSQTRLNLGAFADVVIHGGINAIVLIWFSAISAAAWAFASQLDTRLTGTLPAA